LIEKFTGTGAAVVVGRVGLLVDGFDADVVLLAVDTAIELDAVVGVGALALCPAQAVSTTQARASATAIRLIQVPPQDAATSL
jgi:hypothetical protein